MEWNETSIIFKTEILPNISHKVNKQLGWNKNVLGGKFQEKNTWGEGPLLST